MPSQAEVIQALRNAGLSQMPPPSSIVVPENKTMSEMKGLTKAGGVGLIKGATDVAGLPGDVQGLVTAGLNQFMPQPSDQGQTRAPNSYENMINAVRGAVELPTSQSIQKGIEKFTGPFYQPQTSAEKVAQAGGEAVPFGMLGAEAPLANMARAGLSGAASEAAGQATEGTPYETLARVGAGMGAYGLGTAALGLPDALKALRGEFTPEEAKGFALTSAMGLLPGAKAEGAAVKTMGELLSHYYPVGSSFAKMTPKEYLLTMGEGLPKQLPPDLQKVFASEMQGKVPGAAPIPKTPAQLAKEQGKIYPPIDETAISNALAKNPGASIFDIAKTSIEGPSTAYSPSPLTNSILAEKGYASPDPDTIPREGGVLQVPLGAKILGTSENLVHGTRVGPNAWKTPTGGPMGTEADALRLPDDELGVHFGNPKQAQVFTGEHLDEGYLPRQYPVVVATNNPLRMRDLGSWGIYNLDDSLIDLNAGRTKPGTKVIDSPQTIGQFPSEELSNLHTIQDYRNYLSSKGYDSVVYKNTEEDPGHDSFIKFTPSPEAPDFVTGVRSPFAAFDPAKIMRPELAAGIGGAAALSPQGQEYIQALQNGGQQNQ